MHNKFLYVVLTILLIGCGNRAKNHSAAHNEVNDVKSLVDIQYDNHNIYVVNNTEQALDIMISYIGKEYNYSYEDKKIVINVDSLIRNNNENRNSIALYLLQNDNTLPIIVSANDTTLECQYNFTYNIKGNKRYAKLLNGKAAPLQSDSDEEITISDLKKWLYYNNSYLDEVEIEKFHSIVSNLKQTKSHLYKKSPNVEVPIIKDFKELEYRIDTNIEADYYYLFATNKQSEIEDFIAELVANNFPYAETISSKPLSCFINTETSSGLLKLLPTGGLKTIFLIAIDKKWNKTIHPIGCVIIDDSGPLIYDGEPKWRLNNNSVNLSNDSNVNLEFIKYGFEIQNPIIYNKTESLYVRTGEFYGNNANFIFEKIGDVESITIEYGGVSKSYTVSNKVEPFTINCWLPLNIGENYVTIKAKDKLGNESKHTHKINMVRVDNNQPQINIDNIIDINN